jgi:hypothetical protein
MFECLVTKDSKIIETGDFSYEEVAKANKLNGFTPKYLKVKFVPINGLFAPADDYQVGIGKPLPKWYENNMSKYDDIIISHLRKKLEVLNSYFKQLDNETVMQVMERDKSIFIVKTIRSTIEYSEELKKFTYKFDDDFNSLDTKYARLYFMMKKWFIDKGCDQCLRYALEYYGSNIHLVALALKNPSDEIYHEFNEVTLEVEKYIKTEAHTDVMYR